MPEDKKSNRKNDPKEQRKARRRDPQAMKKDEKPQAPINQEPAVAPKVTDPEKPANDLPGPEFYKSLKRETDEILKITEEANLKYKKKEIQSNWAKYEMPIDSYNETQEQESLGADYETLSQAPLSVGGHFQFKHEKSWDISTGPSLYDKYFEIDMNNLALAVSTIPFYERNCMDQSIFNDTDILNMNNRATRYKQKYYNDKSYTTPELDAQDKILSSLSETNKSNRSENTVIEEDSPKITTILGDITKDSKSVTRDIKLENVGTPVKNSAKFLEISTKTIDSNLETMTKEIDFEKHDILELKSDENTEKESLSKQTESKFVDDIDDIIDIVDKKVDPLKINTKTEKVDENVIIVHDANKTHTVSHSRVNENEDQPKNPVIESPEDLEKWLDDFLDG